MNETEILIRCALIQKGYKQSHLVKELGVTPASISRFVNGTRVSRKFDAWCLLNLDIDLRKIREKKEKAA